MESLNIEYKKDYAIVQIDNGKVNAINTALARDLGAAFHELSENDKVKGILLTGRPHCFSAGLDIVSLAKGGPEGALEFWNYLLPAIQAMIRYPKPLVCAITGYAPAGGTILTLTADYRVMGKGEKHVMGMNEFRTSMQIPELFSDIFAYHLGEKLAWKMIQNATLVNSDQALELGLVDESVEVEEVMERAEKQLKKMIHVYGKVFSKTKYYLRKDLLKVIDKDVEQMVNIIAEDFNDPFVQQSIAMFLASLKK